MGGAGIDITFSLPKAFTFHIILFTIFIIQIIISNHNKTVRFQLKVTIKLHYNHTITLYYNTIYINYNLNHNLRNVILSRPNTSRW